MELVENVMAAKCCNKIKLNFKILSPDHPGRLPEFVRRHLGDVDGDVDCGVGKGQSLQDGFDDEPEGKT